MRAHQSWQVDTATHMRCNGIKHLLAGRSEGGAAGPRPIRVGKRSIRDRRQQKRRNHRMNSNAHALLFMS
jgi:hypothetical protein